MPTLSSMKLDQYELKADEPFTTFEFISEGLRGKILKLVQFTLIDKDHDIYNLAFGDKNYLTGEIDDKIVTDNGDSEKVLATVVAAVYNFCDYFPDVFIYATGSTPARTRLYKMGINKYFDVVESDFDVYGELENEWELYVKGKNYQGFAVQRKKL